MNIAWVLAAEQYIVSEIKSIYSSQGQTVNSKHIELIVRQMFSKVRITSKWDTEFFPWDIVDAITYNNENARLRKEWKKPCIWERLLLGITKISLHTDSWLSAASFQETVRVLVEASTSGKIDKFGEMKENIIIGRLIPAGKQYRKIHNIHSWDNYIEDQYFDNSDDEVNVSTDYMETVEVDMHDDSDF